MARAVKVLRRVLVFRGVTAADMSAAEAGAQVDPGIAHSNALGAEMRFGRGVTAVGEVFAKSHECSCWPGRLSSGKALP